MTPTGELVVSEVFGPTFQGEGPSTGRRAGFVRLGRCNLACGFCDTPYTWRWEDHDPAAELSRRSVADLVADLEAMGVELVVVTGGEPLLQQRHLLGLLAEIALRGWECEIETAGTIAPTPDLVALASRFNVSPKLANSGNEEVQRYKPAVLTAFESTGKAAFKFVVTGPEELDEVQAMVDECGLREVWIMPEGTEPAVLLDRGRRLAEEVLVRGWHLTTRLHVLLWGDKRGR
ncbi:MAG: 7-carboxy-7-deazaguanine synthase QueE, partial [Actinobacteria bacterium]|nr:7-carboxy-7-deazaguanine synthase QueE [Actinomycetota bacterium]MBW3614978.1 7-carboxy-7-deazaguanine synthase QueE [Actinomycetota bacterium]